MSKSQNNKVPNNISALILYPLCALNSIFFYWLGSCGEEFYFHLSIHVLYPDQSVSGNHMKMFEGVCGALLVYICIVCAIAFSRRIEKSKLIIGFFISFFIYVLAPFVYRTSNGGFIDLGPVFDMIILCIFFWFQPGLFFIISFIKRKIDKNKPVPVTSKKSGIMILIILFSPILLTILVAGSLFMSNRTSYNELQVVSAEYSELFAKEKIITIKKGSNYELPAIDKTKFRYYFESNGNIYEEPEKENQETSGENKQVVNISGTELTGINYGTQEYRLNITRWNGHIQFEKQFSFTVRVT